MRIYIKSNELKLPIVMAVPTSAIGWGWIWRRTGMLAAADSAPQISARAARKLAAAIKRYVRENGHFDLVNIHCADGTRVRIRL